MHLLIAVFRLSVPLFVLVICFCGCAPSTNAGHELCTQPWFEYVDDQVQTGDAEGHGPDLGSSEWRSVVEFKLGIRGDSRIPPRDTEQWCVFIHEEMHR